MSPVARFKVGDCVKTPSGKTGKVVAVSQRGGEKVKVKYDELDSDGYEVHKTFRASTLRIIVRKQVV